MLEQPQHAVGPTEQPDHDHLVPADHDDHHGQGGADHHDGTDHHDHHQAARHPDDGGIAATTTTTRAAGSTTTTTSGGKNWSGKTITFGAVAFLDQRAAACEPYGRSQVQGVNLALDQINAAGGINGAHLNLSISDDASDPSTAAANMTTLANRGALAVLGPTFTNSAYVADPVANTLGVPVLAVSNTGPGIVGNCSYPCTWIFRDSLGEATGIPVNVDTVPRKVASEEGRGDCPIG